MSGTGAVAGSYASILRVPFKYRKVILAAFVVTAAFYYSGLYTSIRSYIWREDLIWIEAEDFSFDDDGWVFMDDINFSGYRGIMSSSEQKRAYTDFTVPRTGTYTLWVRFFGNYSDIDPEKWRVYYTNTYGYIDYFGATAPLDMEVAVDGAALMKVRENGSHRYRWVRVGARRLAKGRHRIAVWKSGASKGAVTLDQVLLSIDPAYMPNRIEFIPRTVGGYLGPLVIAVFPLSVLFLAGRGNERSLLPYYIASGVTACMLSIMWIDTDGGFWIWLTQNKAFTLSTIYREGDALHHRYVYPPLSALLFMSLRKVFELFGAMEGLTTRSILLGKLIILPFVFLTAHLLRRIAGVTAALLWLLNSIVIFAVAAHTMYFVLAFLFTLSLYFAKNFKNYLSALSLGLAGAFINVSMLVFPAYLLLLRRLGLKRMLLMALIFVLPGIIVLLPYRVLDPIGLNARVMAAGIATWMKMHMGIRVGDLGLTPLLLTALFVCIWLGSPSFDYLTISASFAAVSLIYLNVSAPYFLLWTVAFQPFIIVWAVKHGHERLYVLYATALIVWGSFFYNTGGALDKAGETGFYPYFNFYAWPFDVFKLLKSIYPGTKFFEPEDLEALSHSVAAGLSAVLCSIIVYRSILTAGVRDRK